MTSEAGLLHLADPFHRPPAVLGPAASAVPGQPELESPPFPNALRAAPEHGVHCGEGASPSCQAQSWGPVN